MAFTYFFRDMQTLEAIRDFVLPDLKTKKYIDIWDAGCAMGQEPYSLSMILNDNMGYMYFRNVRILATDIDESNLFQNIISKAVYPEEQIKRIPKESFDRFFYSCTEDGYYQLSEDIRKSVSFQKHNLLTLTPPGKGFGLVICKNVLLHFNDTQRINVIKMFYEALADGGYLAMEQTQKLPREVGHFFEPVITNAQIYRKVKN